MSKNSPINVFYKNTKLELYALKEILKYGLPAGIQSVIITVSNVVVQYYINGYGENVVAAYAAYFKIESVIYLPIMACGQAITTFVGQNYGIGLYDRIKKGAIHGVLLSCAITIGMTKLVLMVPEVAVRLFINDSEVISHGIHILMTTFPVYWIYAVLVVIGGALRGMGYALTSMIIIMFGLCGLRVVLLYLINQFELHFNAIATVYPITWTITALGFSIIFCIVMIKQRKKLI